MSGLRDYLRCLGAALSDVALCLLLLSLRPVFPPAGGQVYFPAAAWILVLAVQGAVSLFLVRRGAPVNLYIVWNVAAVTLLTVLVFWGTGQTLSGVPDVPGSRDLAVVTAFLAVLTGIHAAASAWYLPKANWLLIYVDALILMLAFYLWAVSMAEIGGENGAALAAVSAIALDLFAVNQIRTREEGEAVIRGSGTGGKLALLGIAAFIAGITAVCVGAGAGQIHSAVDVILVILRLAGMVLAFLLQVFTVAVSAVILLLMLLFPGGSPRVEERVMTNVQETIEEVTGVARFQVPEWFWPAALTAAGLVCLVFVLMKFKGVRFRRPERKKTVHRVTRKNHAFSALKQMAKALISRLSSELRYRKNKNTRAGLLVFAERAGKGRKLGRLAAESPGEYLRRLAAHGTKEEQEKKNDALLSLADRFDQVYYAGGDIPSKEECREYRRELEKYFEIQSV